MTIDFNAWTKATGDLLPGQQAVFLDFLKLVSEEATNLVYGADVREGSPCLVNGVQNMMFHNEVVPSTAFRELVSAFDSVCYDMAFEGLGDPKRGGFVTAIMAEFLIRNFGEVKPIDRAEHPFKDVENQPYIEKSDEEMLQLMQCLQQGAQVQEPTEVKYEPQHLRSE